MTDLIERYLGAIARHLPEGQKADVTAELRDVLLSQIEEAEERLGRPQTREELEALLIRFGHPLTVSGRYRIVQHLIGPEIFPFWWAAIKTTLAVILGIWVVMTIFIIISGDHFAPGRDSGEASLIGVLIFAFGAITLVCALIERFGKTAFLQKWKPSQLPPPEGKSRSRFERVVEIGMSLVFILWWVGAIELRNFLPDYRMSVELAPIWDEVYLPVLVYAGFDMAQNMIGLVRPGGLMLNRAMSLLRNLFALGLIGYIYRAGHWVVVNWGVWSPEVRETVQANFDMGMRIGLVATILTIVALAVIDAWRIWRMVQTRRGAAV
jgi:hypothetical protein